VTLTGLVWRQTWFGARLEDSELIAATAPTARPRDVQHAIEEITQRFAENRPGMDRWAKALVEASRRAEDPVRIQAAWAMQFDAGREEFVARLREMTAADASPLVRRNAACSLAKSGDAAALPVLREMLRTTNVVAPDAGVVSSVPGVGAPVAENGAVARVRRDDGSDIDVRTPVPGIVVERVAKDGARVAAGDAIVALAPNARHALNAAAALALVGTKDDVDLLLTACAPQSEYPDDVKAAARAAVDAIRARSK
jgi:biotin carboxyl carrier protein